MATLQIKYRTEGKALPPRPIKVVVPGWGGSPAFKKENGSEPQPWHCPLFMEGVTHGVELLYQYETECHIINDNGKLRIHWDRDKEPGGAPGPTEMTLSLPLPSQNVLFGTSIDLQPPPGYVLRTGPHPRFFADTTGTVPAALYGHVPGEWWPKKLFVVFKVPDPGKRLIFRKGEPYVQVLFIPKDDYELQAMTPEEASRRRRLEADISTSKSLLAKNVWNSGSGIEFNDHFKVLSRAYEREGMAGVEDLVRETLARLEASVPHGKTASEYLELAKQHHLQNRRVEAKEALHRALKLDPRNAEAYNNMAALEWDIGVRDAAVRAMRRAVALQPRNPFYYRNLGELFRRLGRYEEAQSALTAALTFQPNHPETMTALGYAMGRRGLFDVALQQCRGAIEIAPAAPPPHFVLGQVLSWQNRRHEARASYERALALDPNFAPARQALKELQGKDETTSEAAGPK
jgi:Flp pilus assembly protein TadD